MSNRLISSLEGLKRHFEARQRSYENEASVFGDYAAIQMAVKEIAKRVGAVDAMQPPRDRLREAVSLAFTKGIPVAVETHFRYVCWALFEPWGQPPRCLLDEITLFDVFSSKVEKTCNHGSMSSRDWRGLLEAYFQCEVNHKNHHRLRDVLKNTLPFIQKRKFVPDWLALLNEHRDLLSETPTQRYAEDVLAGRHAVTDQLRNTLGIPLDSWFWRELLLTQVRVVCDRGDERFRFEMEVIIPQLGKDQYQLIRNDALHMLLDRYGQDGNRAVAHAVLKDAALRWWGSPHLERNSKWGLVRPETRKMVRGWLTIQALGDFFTLLQEDRRADERRLEFWRRYQHTIDSFHFALGPLVHDSQEADYRKLREAYREHFCKLTSPGKPHNNAFIFRIGDYSIVEFGMTGNACYCYKNESLPFHCGGHSIDLNALKRQNAATLRLKHTTTSLIPWEDNFTRKLRELGIFPDTPITLTVPRRTVTPTLVTKEKIDALANRARQKNIVVYDKRHLGGVLWIQHLDEVDEFARDLQAMGFRYYRGTGWWRK